jgi:hypothetical protein
LRITSTEDQAIVVFAQVYANCFRFIKAERKIVSMGEEVKRFYLAKVAKLPEEEIVLYEHEMLQQKQPGYLVVLRKQTFGSLYWRGDFPTL